MLRRRIPGLGEYYLSSSFQRAHGTFQLQNLHDLEIRTRLAEFIPVEEQVDGGAGLH